MTDRNAKAIESLTILLERSSRDGVSDMNDGRLLIQDFEPPNTTLDDTLLEFMGLPAEPV